MKNPKTWRATRCRSLGIKPATRRSAPAKPNDGRQAGCLSYFDAIDEMKAAKATKSNDPDTTKRSEKECHNVTGRSPTSWRGVHIPDGLRTALYNLDLAVDRLCRAKPFASDEERLEHLFKLYEEMTGKEELV